MNKERSMVATTDPSLAALRTLAQDCRALGMEAMTAALSRPSVVREGHVMVFVARATTSLEAVELLATRGFVADALSVMRTIVELDIDLAFILQEETERRLELFFGHEQVRAWLLAQAIARLPGEQPPEQVAAMATLRERFDAVRANYPNLYSWCPTRIRERAVATERHHSYDLAYAEGCAASHSGPEGLRHAYTTREEAENTHVTLLVGPQTPNGHPVVLACTSYLMLLASAIDACQLPAFEARHAALLARLSALPTSADSR